MSWRVLAAVVVTALLVAGCTSGAKVARPASPASSVAPAPVAGAGAGAGSGAEPVWLCRPGAAPDPCTSNLNSDAVSAAGATTAQPAAPAATSAFDCFYVYPTVSGEKGPNADLAIQPAETTTAEIQAARFSTACRMWAPMYRQVTVSALVTGGLPAVNTAYESLLAVWKYYLQHDNGGRPFVLIGHSQGAAMLIRLVEEQIDPDPAVRSRLVVAILAGGNLQVPTGQVVGATFKHIPLCTSVTRAGCAVAYSTFGSPPPANALFGRPGTGVSLLSLQVATAGQQVACVNPASLGGGAAPLSPYFRNGVGPTPWVTYPGLYTASCRSTGGASWLQVDPTRIPGDHRPLVGDTLGPEWGYHLYDVNLALGNLVSDVTALEAAYK